MQSRRARFSPRSTMPGATIRKRAPASKLISPWVGPERPRRLRRCSRFWRPTRRNTSPGRPFMRAAASRSTAISSTIGRRDAIWERTGLVRLLAGQLMVDAVRCVAPVGDRCGEGAVWHAAEQALYWTDINRFLVHRYDERAGAVKSWHFDEPVVALALTSRDDTLVVALGSRLLLWEPASDARRDHGSRRPGWPKARLTAGGAAPRGRFWIGSMRNNVPPEARRAR